VLQLRNESLGIYDYTDFYGQPDDCKTNSSEEHHLCLCIWEFSHIELRIGHTFEFDPHSKQRYVVNNT